MKIRSYPHWIRALWAYLISHSGRFAPSRRERLIERIEEEGLRLEDLTYTMLEGTRLGWRYILRLTGRGAEAEAEAERESEEFFREMFTPLEGVEYADHDHPPTTVLERYLRGELEEARHVASPLGAGEGEAPQARAWDWSLSRISLHLATCRECAARAAELRTIEARGEGRSVLNLNRRARMKRQPVGHRRLAYRLLASAAAVLLVVFIGLVLLDHDHSFLFFRPGAPSGPGEKVQVQRVVHEEWKEFHEGSSPLGTYSSIPQPR